MSMGEAKYVCRYRSKDKVMVLAYPDGKGVKYISMLYVLILECTLLTVEDKYL